MLSFFELGCVKWREKTLPCWNILTSAVSTFLKIVLCGAWEEKGIWKVDLFLQDSVFHWRKSQGGKLLFIAPLHVRQQSTKSKTKLYWTLSNPVDNLVELESVNIPCQECGFPSVTADKAEAVKSKEELLMEQLKEKEEEVRHLNECLEAQKKELKEELIEKMKKLELERELRKELESMFQQSLFNIDILRVIQSCWDSILGFQTMEFSA